MKTLIRDKVKGVKAVGGTIRARVRGGRLEPLDSLGLPEGKEVTITVVGRLPAKGSVEAFRRSAGSWKGSVDADRLIRDIYSGRLVSSRPKPRL